MAPGCCTSPDVVKSQTALADCGTAPTETKSRNPLSRQSAVVGVKPGLPELLDCPICLSVMYPPIHQCLNGHTICFNCKTKVNNICPICRLELGNIRCMALEEAAKLMLPKSHCRYCRFPYSYPHIFDHEQSCIYRPFNCPYAGAECSVTGYSQSIFSHLKDDHNVDVHDGSTFNHCYVMSNPQEVENATWMLTVVNCFDLHFCLHFEAFNLEMAPVYMAYMAVMDNCCSGDFFNYSLEVFGSGSRRKMKWFGHPRSIRVSHKEVRESLDGLIIPRKLALLFSGGDGQELKLNIAGRIWV